MFLFHKRESLDEIPLIYMRKKLSYIEISGQG